MVPSFQLQGVWGEEDAVLGTTWDSGEAVSVSLVVLAAGGGSPRPIWSSPGAPFCPFGYSLPLFLSHSTPPPHVVHIKDLGGNTLGGRASRGGRNSAVPRTGGRRQQGRLDSECRGYFHLLASRPPSCRPRCLLPRHPFWDEVEAALYRQARPPRAPSLPRGRNPARVASCTTPGGDAVDCAWVCVPLRSRSTLSPAHSLLFLTALPFLSSHRFPLPLYNWRRK